MTTKAALYLRSSKDRKDVSIDTQRLALTELAAARGIEIVAEFVDVVESGKDEDRPGYQQLIKAVRDRGRGWTQLLINDTARLARRRMISLIFEEQEARRHGVAVIYRSVPEGDDPATTMILRTIMQGFDEHHSMVSRQKGLSGMAENVRKGFRAGGRAPYGYALKHNDTGLVREGKAVTKSTLVPTGQAHGVQSYLQSRAAGRRRPDAKAESGLRLNDGSLNGIEHNALTYAGCTVWNVHRENGTGEGRRRPRSEWVVQADTHEALITRAEAEAILVQLESGKHQRIANMADSRRGMSTLLLSGILTSPAGIKWDAGGRDSYRHRVAGQPSRYVPARDIEAYVMDFVRAEILTDGFVSEIIEHTVSREVSDKPRKDLQRQLMQLHAEQERAINLASQMSDPAPILRRIEALEQQRAQLLEDQARADREIKEARLLARITPAQVREALSDLGARLEDDDRRRLRLALQDLLEKVELDPADLSVRIHYRVAVDCRKGVAFPRGFEPRFYP